MVGKFLLLSGRLLGLLVFLLSSSRLAWSNENAGFDAASRDGFFGFFRKLFSADFMPHGHCYFWRPELVWLHVVSDALITVAYYAIPAVLIFFVRKRKDFPFPWVLAMFGAFILLCGTTHLMAVVTLWEPIYRLDGVLKALTAGVSVLTAVAMVPLIPKALALRSPKELEEANAKLNAANEDLREMDKLKDNFLSNVSHELRTPLTLILAPLESLLAEEFGATTPAQKQSLQSIHNNSVRLYQMVNSILDYAKVTSRKSQANREAVEVVSLTESLLGEFHPIFNQKKLKVEFHFTGERRQVSIDRYFYERILFNLLSNAEKFTPVEGSIAVTLSFVGDKLVLAVKDSGIGISEVDRQQLFQRFRQVESSSTRRFEGTGLGLALVREFAALLQGTVEVQSKPGKGSTFTVTLTAPVAKEAESESQERSRQSVPRFEINADERGDAPLVKENASRILIAEDNSELAFYLKSLLAGMGYATLRAKDGEDALNKTREWKPDLVLADVMMPKLDGFSLCRQIKQDPTTGGIPVVLLTALTHRNALIKGWESGADEYLFKPFHPTELRVRVRSILDLVEARKRREEEAERRRELEQFSYFASHDLKEPVRVMSNVSGLLKQRYQGKFSDDADQLIGFITEASERMQAVIDDLIAYSIVESTKLHPEPTSTQVAVEEATKNLNLAISETGACVSFSSLPTVFGEKIQLVRLFQNLIGNAVKYRSEAAPRISISAKRVKDEWTFMVKDNGIGFDPKYAEHIFLIFKRLHDQTKYAGTGVGLAICKRIVTRHGGRIWAESKPGEGATFYFTLPAQKARTFSNEAGMVAS